MPELNPTYAFIAMVFVAVFLLTMGMSVPVFGERSQAKRRLRKRLRQIDHESTAPPINSLLREKYLKQLNPFERSMESLPQMERLSELIEQSGHHIPAYRVVLISLILGVFGALIGWILLRNPLLALLSGLIGLVLPFLKIYNDRRNRMDRFEEQLPEAIDIMKRALQAGHPFSESLHLVADELEDPIAREFGITFADLNYGNDLKRAMLGLLERIPSITLIAFVTSVLIQKETGGNLVEVLDKIGKVIRDRFRFQRKVKTLSAEGRLSAWILALVPFVLFILISITTPNYLPVLIEEPMGRTFIAYAFVLMIVGIFWLRRILRIEV